MIPAAATEGEGEGGRERHGTFRAHINMTSSKAINDQPLLGHLFQLLGHDGVSHADLDLQLPAHHTLSVIRQLWGRNEGVKE